MSMTSPYSDIAMFSIPSKRKSSSQPKHRVVKRDTLHWHKVTANEWTAQYTRRLVATCYRISGAWQVTMKINGNAKGFPLRTKQGDLVRTKDLAVAQRAAYDAMNTPHIINA